MHVRRSVWIFLIIASLGLAACTRSASQSPTAVPAEATQEAGEQLPENMATAVAGGGFLTQTAEAQAAGGGEQDQGEPTAAPVETEPPPEPTAQPTQPPPKPTKTPTPEPTKPPEQPQAQKCESPYTVSQGEWVWSIGRKCNIHPDAIIEANKLQWPYTLYPGDKLILPEDAPPFPPGG